MQRSSKSTITMPKIKVRANSIVLERQKLISLPITAQETGDCASCSEAATAFELLKSTLGHPMNGRQSRQNSQEGDQILSPAAEKAIVRWIFKLESHGFLPHMDRVWQMAESLPREERMALRICYEKEGRKNIVHDSLGRNWITKIS